MLNTLPELLKGVFKGVIKGMYLQNVALRIHVALQLVIFPIMTYVYAFHFDMGVVGLWYAKITLEWCLIISYITLLNLIDWEERAEVVSSRLASKETPAQTLEESEDHESSDFRRI